MDKAWNEKHLTALTDYVVMLLDNADNVPDYLISNPSIFKPQNILEDK